MVGDWRAGEKREREAEGLTILKLRRESGEARISKPSGGGGLTISRRVLGLC